MRDWLTRALDWHYTWLKQAYAWFTSGENISWLLNLLLIPGAIGGTVIALAFFRKKSVDFIKFAINAIKNKGVQQDGKRDKKRSEPRKTPGGWFYRHDDSPPRLPICPECHAKGNMVYMRKEKNPIRCRGWPLYWRYCCSCGYLKDVPNEEAEITLHILGDSIGNKKLE